MIATTAIFFPIVRGFGEEEASAAACYVSLHHAWLACLLNLNTYLWVCGRVGWVGRAILNITGDVKILPLPSLIASSASQPF